MEELVAPRLLDKGWKNAGVYMEGKGMSDEVHGIKIDELHVSPGANYDVQRDQLVGVCYEHCGGEFVAAYSTKMRCVPKNLAQIARK